MSGGRRFRDCPISLKEALLAKSRFSAYPASERLALAKARADKLMHHIASLFLMHESNAVVIYSQKLSEQIPRSYAAHAFNQFQRSMHLFEIVRLCAMWDEPGNDRESIPTIIALFNEPKLIDRLVAEAHAFHANELPPDTVDRESASIWWRGDRQAFADQVAATIRGKLAFAVSKAEEVLKAPQLQALMAFRHSYIAHNLNMPDPSGDDEGSVEKPQYGDETFILDATVDVADALHRGLNRTAFDWKGSRDMARRNARALWDHCTFQIPVRPPRQIPPVAFT
jgi:AbiU2